MRNWPDDLLWDANQYGPNFRDWSIRFFVTAAWAGLAVVWVLGNEVHRLPLEIALAVLVIAATRGGLSYERYRRETAADGPWPHA